jgi:malonyl-CoA/methylmalonyl-CoA synthetase
MLLNIFLSGLTTTKAGTLARKFTISMTSRTPFHQSLRMASTLPKSPVFDAIAKHDPKSLAIVHSGSDRSFCYGSLLHDVAAAKDNLTNLARGKSLRGERIAFLAENGYDYVGAERV